MAKNPIKWERPAKVLDFPYVSFTCKKCQVEKPMAEFQRDKHRKNGHAYSCKSCMRPLKKESGRRWRDKPENRDEYRKKDRWYQRKYAYGITKEQFFEILAKQGGGCAICKHIPPGEVDKHMVVDHHHASGVIRGLLCQKCNRSLGMFKDSVSLLRTAALYLERSGAHEA
jgi:hypothetical protein